jgi:large conductance mechanosensitive channel
MVVKLMNTAKSLAEKKEAAEETPAAPPEPSKEELLLTEIRDLLKEK